MERLVSFVAKALGFAVGTISVLRGACPPQESRRPAYRGHEFEALKTRYDDHVVLLRALTDVDLRVFSGYITIQLVFGAWLSANSVEEWTLKIGLVIIDLTLSFVAGWLLFNNSKRREEVVAIVKNLNEALGYTQPGIYLANRPINVQTKDRPWVYGYFVGVVTAAVGVVLIILSPPARPDRNPHLEIPTGAVVSVTVPAGTLTQASDRAERRPTPPLQPTTTAPPSR